MNEENVNQEVNNEEKTNQCAGSNTEANSEIHADKGPEIKEGTNNNVTSEESKVQNDKLNTMEPDLSKVKVSHVLAYKFKKGNPKLKKVIAAVLLGLVCFGTGAATDRAFTRHELRGGFYGKYQIRRNLPGNFYGGKRFDKGQNRNQNPNNIPQTPSNGQPQK